MKTEISWNFIILSGVCLAAAVALLMLPQFAGVETFVFVLTGWLVSLCVHEYAHARFAFAFGDHSIEERRYLSLDPVLYFRSSSLILPVLALVAGGIALPGGAVLIRNDLIRKRWQQSVVALAGPFVTFVCGGICYGLAQVIGGGDSAMLHDALILLVFFELMAFVLNILPVPGLDGFAALKPWLPRSLTTLISPKVGGLVQVGLLLLVFFQGARLIFPLVFLMAHLTGMDLSAAGDGYDRFHFWPGN